jgi:hypothetical protein
MEDISSIALEAYDIIYKEFKDRGIEITDEEGDKIFVPLLETLEKFCNYPDYRNYN